MNRDRRAGLLIALLCVLQAHTPLAFASSEPTPEDELAEQLMEQRRLVGELSTRLTTSDTNLSRLRHQLEESRRLFDTLQALVDQVRGRNLVLEGKNSQLLRQLELAQQEHAVDVEQLNFLLEGYRADELQWKRAQDAYTQLEHERQAFNGDQRFLERISSEAQAEAESLRESLQLRDERIREFQHTIDEQQRALKESEQVIRLLTSNQ